MLCSVIETSKLQGVVQRPSVQTRSRVASERDSSRLLIACKSSYALATDYFSKKGRYWVVHFSILLCETVEVDAELVR